MDDAVISQRRQVRIAGRGYYFRRIVLRKQSPAAHLPRDGCDGGVRIADRRLPGLRAFRAGTAIIVTHHHAPALVHVDSHEVEHVAANVRTAAEPNATALDGIVRRSVDGQPGLAAVVGMSDVEMPDPTE